MTSKNEAFMKARVNRDKKRVYNQYSDFSRDIPNLIKVGKKYKNSGNVCLGYAKNAGDWRPWRFGKHPIMLHPSTVIQIEGGQTLWLQTANVCDYLQSHKDSLRELDTNKFKGLKTRSYIVNIQDLVNFDLELNYKIAGQKKRLSGEVKTSPDCLQANGIPWLSFTFFVAIRMKSINAQIPKPPKVNNFPSPTPTCPKQKRSTPNTPKKKDRSSAVT